MLKFKNIRKAFSGVEVLHNISFSLHSGKIIALVGENGAGKSTLMKILCGILPDYEGQVLLNRQEIRPRHPREAERLGISMIHQELNLVSDLSVGENIFLGKEPLTNFKIIDFKKLFNRADAILQEFNFPFSSRIKVRNIPIGWQQMVEIARTLWINTRILVMDEPTSALSEHEIELLFDKMKMLKSMDKTIIFITHRLSEVFEIADEITVLRDGNYVGKFNKNEITREYLISKMIGHHLPGDLTARFKSKERKEVLSLSGVRVKRNRNIVLDNIEFKLHRGEILGIAGLLGSGRTELLKFLYGELKGQISGHIAFQNINWIPESAMKSIKNGIVFLSENRKEEGIFPHHSVLFNTSIAKLKDLSQTGFVMESREKELTEQQLNSLKTKRHSLTQKIPTLSGGNQQKVLIARDLLLNPILFLLDEPTRGIDVGAKEEIYQLIGQLSQQGASILVTSSEIPELMRISHRILVLSRGDQTAILETSGTNPREILT
ncbi:MAG: sugar ABC transporter ATP-binding protein, partial [Calditrichaeota bacterium]